MVALNETVKDRRRAAKIMDRNRAKLTVREDYSTVEVIRRWRDCR